MKVLLKSVSHRKHVSQTFILHSVVIVNWWWEWQWTLNKHFWCILYEIEDNVINNVVFSTCRNSTLSRSATGIINLPRTGCDARFLENVEVYVDYSYSGFRGTVEFTLISPSGTKAVFNNVRTSDATINYQPGTHQWTWRVVSFWGERALGRWRLLYKSVNRNEEGIITHKLKILGSSPFLFPWHTNNECSRPI